MLRRLYEIRTVIRVTYNLDNITTRHQYTIPNKPLPYIFNAKKINFQFIFDPNNVHFSDIMKPVLFIHLDRNTGSKY
jgi:hypothetical protein